jgi:hypothetical protein
MMQDMYGLLEPTESEKAGEEGNNKKEIERHASRRGSTTSSVNT